MNNSKDPNYVAKLEKAISAKYGSETIGNPKSNWDPNKEEEYLAQLSKENKLKYEQGDKKSIKNRSTVTRKCNVCNKNQIKRQHDVYFTKFQCCFECYVQWVEGREERWSDGWRPENELQTDQRKLG